MANLRIKNGDELYDENNRMVGIRQPDGTETLFVTAEQNATGGYLSKTWTGSQAQYDAIAVKDNSTLYVIV